MMTCVDVHDGNSLVQEFSILKDSARFTVKWSVFLHTNGMELNSWMKLRNVQRQRGWYNLCQKKIQPGALSPGC